ncbi:hypothetical protein FACS1894187_15070 [Synergistales bacterium]|nr:hypothetical protein FACS1894187_15070 [Synergistales bacterium]
MQTLKQTRTARRRILSLPLALTLVIGLLTLAPLTAFAASSITYVSADVTQYDATVDQSTADWDWDTDTNTFTLTGDIAADGIQFTGGTGDVTFVVNGTRSVVGGIESQVGKLTLSGTNTPVLNVSRTDVGPVLLANSIDISGLTINVDATNYSIAVTTNNGNFTMSSGTLNLSSTGKTGNGLLIDGDIIISGGTIQTDGTNTIAGAAVQATGNVNISGTAIVNVKSTDGTGIHAENSLTISGGVVTAEGLNAISAVNDIDISGNSTVTATSTGTDANGIFARYGNITIKDASKVTTTGTGTDYALNAGYGTGDVSISGGSVVTTNSAAGAGVVANNITVDGTGTTLTAQTGTAIDARGDVTVSGGATVTGASGETTVVLTGSGAQTVTVDGSGSKIEAAGTGTAIDASRAKGAVTVNVIHTGVIDAGTSGTAVVGTATVTGDGTGSVIGLTVPDAPTNVTATAGNARATVKFTAPANDGGAAITLYTATSNPESKTATSTTASPITVTGLTNGTTYTFTVTAANSRGPSEPSEESNAVTPSENASVTVPDAPTNVSATAGDAWAIVTFTAPANDGGTAITGYKVTAVEDPTKTATGTASPITVTGLTNGTEYTFTVTATNSVGPSEPSAASNAVTPSEDTSVTVPDAPVNVTATAGNAEATVKFTAPANDGGAAITLYTATSNPESKTATSTTASPITVIGLTNGTTYTFTVTAANSRGPSEPSEESNPVTPSADNLINEPDGSRNASGGCDAGAGLMALAALALLITNRSGKGRL